MKLSKKLTVIFVLFALALSLAGCSANTAAPAENRTTLMGEWKMDAAALNALAGVDEAVYSDVKYLVEDLAVVFEFTDDIVTAALDAEAAYAKAEKQLADARENKQITAAAVLTAEEAIPVAKDAAEEAVKVLDDSTAKAEEAAKAAEGPVKAAEEAEKVLADAKGKEEQAVKALEEAEKALADMKAAMEAPAVEGEETPESAVTAEEAEQAAKATEEAEQAAKAMEEAEQAVAAAKAAAEEAAKAAVEAAAAADKAKTAAEEPARIAAERTAEAEAAKAAAEKAADDVVAAEKALTDAKAAAEEAVKAVADAEGAVAQTKAAAETARAAADAHLEKAKAPGADFTQTGKLIITVTANGETAVSEEAYTATYEDGNYRVSIADGQPNYFRLEGGKLVIVAHE